MANRERLVNVYSKDYGYFRIFEIMEEKDFNRDKLIEYWIAGSDEDYETMIAMYNIKRYSWSLFIGHLMIEKILKAYYVK